MKILHVVRQFYPCIGGVENYVLNLARQQIKHGHKVAVLTLNKSFIDGKTFPSNEIHEGIEIQRIPYWGSRRYPIALSCINYLGSYDIVNIHCVDFFVDYLVALKIIHKKKLILNTHGGIFHTKWLRIFKKIYFNIVTPIILLGCDIIIANSKPDYELFKKISKNVTRIDNGVEVEKYGLVVKNVEKGSLVYIGRLDVHKRIDNLINVTSVLIRNGHGIKLKIIGPDWKGIRPKLEYLSEALGIRKSVLFMGQLKDEELVKELSSAYVFVSASEYEAFGISAVEAMASGTPCVLNNIDSFREFLDNESCGYLTDFNNHKRSAGIISKLLEMDQDSFNIMSLNARKRAGQYSWNIITKKIMNVYEEVLSGR